MKKDNRGVSTLQFQALILALLVSVPGIIFSIYSGLAYWKQSRDFAQLEASRLLVSIDNIHDYNLAIIRGILGVLSQEKSICCSPDNEKIAPKILQEAVESFGDLVNIYILRPGEREEVAATAKKMLPEKYYENILARGEQIDEFTGNIYSLSTVTGQPVLTFSLPVRSEDGSLEVLLAAELNPVSYAKALVGVTVEQGYKYSILDQEGLILYSGAKEAKNNYEKRVSPTAIRMIHALGKSGAFQLKEDDSTTRQFIFKRLDLDGDSAYLQVELPYDIINYKKEGVILNTLLGILISTGAALFLALLFMHLKIWRPHKLIFTEASRIVDAEYPQKINLSKNNDFFKVAEAFNTLIEKLENCKRTNILYDKKIEDVAVNLEILLSASSEPIMIIDFSGIILNANKNAAALYGLREDQMPGRSFFDNLPASAETERKLAVFRCMNGQREVIVYQNEYSEQALYFYLHPLKNSSGNPEKIAVFCRNRSTDA